MLTIDSIVSLYKEGVELILDDKEKPYGLKGVYDSGEQKAIAYLQNNTSKDDINMTIIHELIHARDFILEKPECDLYNPKRTQYQEKELDLYEQRVEEEAVVTYRNQPKIIDFIKEILL